MQKESKNQLLVMQGRLTPQFGDSIQFFPKENWEKEFEYVKYLGLDGIEWTIDLINFDSHPLITVELTNNKYVSLDKYKFITCDFFMHIDIFKDTEVRLDIAEKLLIKLILSRNVGNGATLVVPLVDSGKPITSSDWKNVTTMFYKLIPLLSGVNSRIVFELSIHPSDQLEFINKFEASYFGINFDIGNSASLGWNPKEEINTLKEAIKHIHIKDRKLHGSTVPLGEGNADFVQISQSLKEIMYKGNYTLQCARISGQSEIVTIERYVKYLNNVGLI